jgi:soluble lytic murein transglycosylase-like protein
VLLLGLVALALPHPARADDLVVFRHARTLRVASASLQDGVWVLDHGAGNVVRVPASVVKDVRRIPRRGPPARARADWREKAGEYAAFIGEAARRFELEPELLVAVAVVESALDPFAESDKGALGVMQIMPATAEELGLENPFDAEQNIGAGARFLREMLDLYDNDLELALAAYNAGQGAVERYGGVPPFPETRTYLERVRQLVADLGGGA